MRTGLKLQAGAFVGLLLAAAVAAMSQTKPGPDAIESRYGNVDGIKIDPLVISEDVVLVDAVERKSGESCRVRIPLNIVKMATEQSSQTYAA